MPAEDLGRTVQRQCFDCMTSSGRGCGPKERVIDGFLGGLDHGEEQWRHCIVCYCFLIAWRGPFVLTRRFNPHVRRGREGDGVITAAVAGGSAGPGQAHHGPRPEATEIAGVDWRIRCNHDDN